MIKVVGENDWRMPSPDTWVPKTPGVEAGQAENVRGFQEIDKWYLQSDRSDSQYRERVRSDCDAPGVTLQEGRTGGNGESVVVRTALEDHSPLTARELSEVSGLGLWVTYDILGQPCDIGVVVTNPDGECWPKERNQ